MSSLQEELAAVAESERIKAALLVSRDGLLIESYCQEDRDLEAVGALVSSGFDSLEAVVKEFTSFSPGWALMRYDGGSLLLQDMEFDTLLIMLIDDDAWLGSVDEAVCSADSVRRRIGEWMELASNDSRMKATQGVGEIIHGEE